MVTRRFQTTLMTLLLSIFLLPVGFCDTVNDVLRDFYNTDITDPTQSPCCNRIMGYCRARGHQCADFIQHESLVHSCRCIPTMEYEMQRYLDSCLREADEIIATRLEKEMSRMVIRKMPSQTRGTGGENSGYEHPGRQPQYGARQPSLINQENKLNDINAFRNQILQSLGKK